MDHFVIYEALDKLSELGIKFSFYGDSSLVITHARSIEDADQFSVSFCRGEFSNNLKHLSSKENLIILSEQNHINSLGSGNYILTDSPDLCFCIIGSLLKTEIKAKVHQSAIISKTAFIGFGASIGANVQIEKDVVIGDRVIIDDGCFISNSLIGDDCHIGAGVKIGGSGLGSHRNLNGKWQDFPHFGKVVIGSSVVIQENSVVHRGTLSDTVIEDGVRIGPLCWIAHNVQIGIDCFIGQGVTIAGSCKVFRGAKVWGNAALADGVVINEDAVVGMGAVVINNIPKGELWAGNPAKFKK